MATKLCLLVGSDRRRPAAELVLGEKEANWGVGRGFEEADLGKTRAVETERRESFRTLEPISREFLHITKKWLPPAMG